MTLLNFFKKTLNIKLYRLILLIFSYCFIAFAVGVLISHSSFILNLASDTKKLLTYSSQTLDEGLTSWIDDEQNSHNGLVLISPHYFNNDSKDHPALMLVDKNANIVHKWYLEHKQETFRLDHFMLEKDGNVIITTASSGYGDIEDGKSRIVKLDKDSNIIWENTANFHHWFDKYQNNIYALTSQNKKISEIFPDIDFTAKQEARYVEHFVSVLSEQTGEITKNISISQAFINSDYKDYLNLAISIGLMADKGVYDILHTNTVQYLDKKLTTQFSFAKEGDLLLSLRQMDLIAILRPSSQKIIWAKRGEWLAQHHAKLIDNEILIFDNEGGGIVANSRKEKEKDRLIIERRPRIFAYDPITQKTRLIYHNTQQRALTSGWLSGYHKLNNGHYLIFSSNNSRIIEIDENKNILWELRGIKDRDQNKVHDLAKIPQMLYFERSQLDFIQ